MKIYLSNEIMEDGIITLEDIKTVVDKLERKNRLTIDEYITLYVNNERITLLPYYTINNELNVSVNY